MAAIDSSRTMFLGKTTLEGERNTTTLSVEIRLIGKNWTVIEVEGTGYNFPHSSVTKKRASAIAHTIFGICQHYARTEKGTTWGESLIETNAQELMKKGKDDLASFERLLDQLNQNKI